MARKTRDSDTGQLDLFLTGTEPAPAESPAPRLVIDPTPPGNPEPSNPIKPSNPIESDMPPESPIPPTSPIPDLPPPPDDPPEVAADIRAMFLEEEERQRAEETITIREGKPPLVTGIYRKPRAGTPKPLVLPLADPLRRPSDPSAPAASSLPQAESRPPRAVAPPPPRSPNPPAPPRDRFAAIRNYFAGANLGRKGLWALLGAIVLVALLAWWAGAPKHSPTPSAPQTAYLPVPESTPEVPPPAGNDEAPSAPEQPPVAMAEPPSAPATPGAPAKGLRIPGATVTLAGDGSWLVRYDAAVFVSADKISVEGMKALKATAAALLKLPDGATVSIHGHTDDIPPPPDATGPFRTNADLAAARAKMVLDHLTVFCKRQSRYVFEVAAPGTSPAPYPNDTDAHRRLNRTATLRIVPTGRTAD